MGRGGWEAQFRWLWAAFAVSTFGTWLAFDAFPIIAVLALHARPAAVSLLAAGGLAVSAVVALPLGPWVERRRKRRTMVALDALRFAVLAAVPAAYLLGRLRFGQLLVAAVVVGAADVGYRAASGSCLKELVPAAGLLTAGARLESTTWTATMLGPPLGGTLIAAFGPVATVVADAASYLLSALGVGVIARGEPVPAAASAARDGDRLAGLVEGWRWILRHPGLRGLLLNTAVVNALVMAPAPLLAVLLLGQLHLPPWQYGLAFALPCAGGLLGARLTPRLAARHGTGRVLRVAGTLRACWSLGLAFVPAGWAGVALVAVIEFGLITCSAVFNPVAATYRLRAVPADRPARILTAWTISTKLAVAGLTALWGALAAVVGVRAAIALAGVALLATPLLLPARRHLDVADPDPEPDPEAVPEPEPGPVPRAA